MGEKVYVIGHKNPDTDSIASSMAYAALKVKLGIDAEARRLGTLNEETKFATRKFNVEAPMLISDARSQLYNLDIDEPVLISENASCNDAVKRIVNTNTKTLFVADEKQHLLGIVSVGDLSSLRMNSYEKRVSLMKNTNLEILSSDIEGKIVVDTEHFKTNGIVNIITAGSVEHARKKVASSICIVLNDELIQKELIECGASCLILGLGTKPTKRIKDIAKKAGVAIITTPYMPMEIARVIYESIPLSFIMTRNVTSYLDTDYVEDVALKIANTRYRCYPVVDETGKIVGSISRYHLFKYKKKNFILVDHSSKIQSIDHVDKAEILEIIDHHHIGDVETTKPIYYRNQKCGCTASIVYQLYKENDLEPDKSIAGMMLSAIISDTLYFQSETTTPSDIKIAHKLAQIAEVNLDEYARELLNSSVNLKDGDVNDLIERDLKRYEFGKYRIAVGQTNYSNLEDIQSRIKEFETVMKDKQERNDFDLIVMMFTHVLADGTMFLFYGPLSYLMFDLIQTRFDDNSGYDHNIMSRKQQLIPVLSDLILNL